MRTFKEFCEALYRGTGVPPVPGSADDKDYKSMGSPRFVPDPPPIPSKRTPLNRNYWKDKARIGQVNYNNPVEVKKQLLTAIQRTGYPQHSLFTGELITDIGFDVPKLVRLGVLKNVSDAFKLV